MTLENLEKNYIKYIKVSASAHIIYHCNISPESMPGIVIYILSIGRSDGVGTEILSNMYTYDKIINSHTIAGVSQMINK